MTEESSSPLNPASAGLCSDCRHAQIVRSARDSVFVLCQRSKTDARYPRYPRLPILTCPGHEKKTTDNEA